jgi:hypothetical protein
LAQQLRRFDICPRVIRVGEETARGYLLDDFREAFSRYLPSTPLPDRNTVTTLGETVVFEPEQANLSLHSENELPQSECYAVTPPKDGEGGNSESDVMEL